MENSKSSNQTPPKFSSNSSPNSSSTFAGGSTEQSPPPFTDKELEFLMDAAKFFDNPGLFIKGLNFLSTPIEIAQNKLPQIVRTKLARVSRSAIEHALILSIKSVSTQTSSLDLSQAQEKSKTTGKIHSGVASAIGGFGGFFGLAALPLEIPLVTVVMLRSIVEIANQHGVDLSTADAKLDCLYILSLHGGSPNEGTLKSEYYTSRIAFAELLSSASSFIAANTAIDILTALENRTAPALMRLIAEIATRFELQLTRKFFAQITPMVGAIGGASLNLLFTNYYNTSARFHFGLKNLEKIHGIEATQKQFEKFRPQPKP